MRARGIKPGFYKNADLAECSAFARLLAPGLWMLADRAGRLEDRPKQIKGEIFPYDNVDVDALLGELEKWNHIIRYSVDGKNYIQIAHFEKHQNPHIKEKQSDIPKSTVLAPDKPGLGITENPLIPDSLTPDSSSTEEKRTPEDDFAEIRAIYPKQRAGNWDKGFAAYKRALKRATHEEILAGVRAYAASEEVAIGRAKGCEAWMNDDRWTVDYSYGAKPKAAPPADPNRIIGREEYERCKKIIGAVADKRSLQAIIGRYEAQNRPKEALSTVAQTAQGNGHEIHATT